MVLMAGLGLALGAQAEIFKCNDAQGKVTIGDQPCSSSQEGGAIKVVPQSGVVEQKTIKTGLGNAAYSGVGSPAEVQKFQNELLQALTPECQNLTRRAWAVLGLAGKNPINKVSPQAEDQLLTEFSTKCEAPTKDFLDKYHAANALTARRKYECDAKKSVLDDKRPKFEQLDEQSKRAFKTVEQEYANLKCK